MRIVTDDSCRIDTNEEEISESVKGGPILDTKVISGARLNVKNSFTKSQMLDSKVGRNVNLNTKTTGRNVTLNTKTTGPLDPKYL